ncbi:MAG: aminotransferase class V-fold PLP-dependent enzyme [Acidobacteriota bacterium]
MSPAALVATRTTALPFPLSAPRQQHYYRARNALYQLFRSRPAGRVLVPDYHHGNEVRAIRAAGAEVVFYRIDRRLRPDLDELRQQLRAGATAIVAIHYLGLAQPVREIAALAREYGALFVEDCALALLSDAEDGTPLGSVGDASVFCLYKTLPVPNGAVLVGSGLGDAAVPRGERACGAFSLGGRVAELLVDGLRVRHPGVGGRAATLKARVGGMLTDAGVHRDPTGETGFDVGAVDLRMSRLTSYLLGRFDYAEIRRRRRGSFLALRDRLAGRASLLVEALPQGAVPLFFPILVQDKRAAAAALRARGVAAVEFWNDGDPAAHGFDAMFLRRHVLELPLHQDLDAGHVEFVANQVLDVIGART